LLAFFAVAPRLFSSALRSISSSRLGQFHTCASSFRKADRDSLFCVRRAMLSFTNVMHLFADEFAGLSAGRLAFFFVSLRSFNYFLFWHDFAPELT
jgi:hypothetical protein